MEVIKKCSHRSTLIVILAGLLMLVLAAAMVQAQPSRTAEMHYSRGNALYELGESDRAIDEFDKAIEINPRLASAWGARRKRSTTSISVSRSIRC
jgi:tetratricopeptide (TPR) repeat protein